MTSDPQNAIIVGAGPAGLTAAYELLARTSIRPIVLEKSEYMGGISRTVNYKGNRIDIGGHRFFSTSSRVMDWWLQMLPLERPIPQDAPTQDDRVMLVRRRKSSIYYRHRLFDYPISLGRNLLLNIGLWRAVRIGASYLRVLLFPLREETNLEQFLINRFGRELYSTFFQAYTEKLWGIQCHQISAEWGAQRIKGLSAGATLRHAWNNGRRRDTGDRPVGIVSLIDHFLYPKYGPGQMWEEVAHRIRAMGGEIRTGWSVDRMLTDGYHVTALEATNCATGQKEVLAGDYFFSSAPVKELMHYFDVVPPAEVLQASDGLVYRDSVIVGLLVHSLLIHEETPGGKQLIRDNWIYIQEPGVRLGRLQIFNNWSPHLVADPSNIWLGLEYVCSSSDELWQLSDERMTALAREELSRIGIIEATDVIDSTVIRMEKTYPAYIGTHSRFAEIRRYVDQYDNLFLVGRNGMHRYNNQDHSMLTAMVAVDQILNGAIEKSALWDLDARAASPPR